MELHTRVELENKKKMAKKTELLSDRLIFRLGDFAAENRVFKI